MGQAWSTFLVPGLPSCSGRAWGMIVAARAADHGHLATQAEQEPLLLLACTLKNFSLIHTAADAGSVSTLQLLVELITKHAQQLSARLQEVLAWSSSGTELLKHLRNKGRHEQMAQLLDPSLALQALLSWQDIKGVTPLMLAARGGHAACLQLLLEHGANPLLLDCVNRRSCLHYAAGAGHTRCVNMLLNEYVTVHQPSALMEDQPQRWQQRLVLLPDAVLPDSSRGSTSFVDLRTRTGFSALHYATFWGFVGCVQALLTAGASIDQPMSNPSRQHSELPVVNGCTPLHVAADCGHTALAALLLHAHVAHMAQRNSAAVEYNPQEWLPWEGVPNHDPRLRRNASGHNPLMLAENRCNSSEVMRMLLDPYAPISRTLPLVLEVCFGGPPRFGVPSLAALAKGALDKHLTGTLDKLEQLQKQAKKQSEQQQALPPALTLCGLVGADEPLLSLQQQHLEGLDGLTAELTGTQRSANSSTCNSSCASISRTSSGLGSSPAASRSTSLGSISSLLSTGTLGSSSSTEPSLIASCSNCVANSSMSTTSSGAGCAGFRCGTPARALSLDSTIAESVVTSATDRTCAICFDAAASVMMASCSHCVCISCARSLLSRASSCKPALCPFCRGGLTGFLAAPLT